MTPEERAYAAAWMAEMWATVPERHQTKDERLEAKERTEWVIHHQTDRAGS